MLANHSVRHSMWTGVTRPQYDRANRRYASDPRSEPGAGIERCRMEPDRTLLAATELGGELSRQFFYA